MGNWNLHCHRDRFQCSNDCSNMTASEREYIRHARSEILKSLRRRDARMFQDVQKSVSLFGDLPDSAQTLADRGQSDDLTIRESVL